jgi:hypothetical protein
MPHAPSAAFVTSSPFIKVVPIAVAVAILSVPVL